MNVKSLKNKNMKKLRFFILLVCSILVTTSLSAQDMPTKERKVFFGANIGVGMGKIKDYPTYVGQPVCESKYRAKLDQFILGKVGLDFAYRLKDDNISLGAYTGWGTDSRMQIQYLDLGGLMLFDIENKPASMMAGIGTHIADYKFFGVNLRAGILFPRNIYIMLEYNYNGKVDESCNTPHDNKINSFMISFGYRIL